MMACSYTNIDVDGVPCDMLLEYLDYIKAPAFVSPNIGPHLIVYDEFGEDSLAEDISRELRCRTFFVANHHDDLLWYQLFKNGKSLDRYNSRPGYYETPHVRVKPEGGDAAVLCDTFYAPGMVERVEEILRKDYAFEVRRHLELAEVLRIPTCSVGVGYNDIERGELPPVMLSPQVLQRTPRDSTDFEVILWDNIEQGGSRRPLSVLSDPKDLENLTMRALVAIAARAARRAQKCAAIPGDLVPRRKYSDPIDKAISLAEEFAAGGSADERFRNRVAVVLTKCDEIDKELQIVPNAGSDVLTVASTAASAGNAAKAALLFGGVLDPTVRMDRDGNIRIAVQFVYEAMKKGITTNSDWLCMKLIGTGNNSDPGEPIDPSDSGPFGALLRKGE